MVLLLRCGLSTIRQSRQHVDNRSVVTEGLAHVGENVPIAGREDEAGAQLERVLAQFVLAVASRLGLLAGGEIIPSEEVEEVALPYRVATTSAKSYMSLLSVLRP